MLKRKSRQLACGFARSLAPASSQPISAVRSILPHRYARREILGNRAIRPDGIWLAAKAGYNEVERRVGVPKKRTLEHATVVAVERIRRQQILREAEGYLDLLCLFGEEWAPAAPIRRRLAQRSLDMLDRLAERNAPGPQTHLLRGQALRAADRYAEAIEPLQAAVAADSSMIDAWLALGWCFKRTGHLNSAIESLKEALVIDPEQGILHYNLSCYWSLAGNVPLALHHLQRALALDSNFRTLAEREADFDPIRSDPGFQTLTSVIV